MTKSIFVDVRVGHRVLGADVGRKLTAGMTVGWVDGPLVGNERVEFTKCGVRVIDTVGCCGSMKLGCSLGYSGRKVLRGDGMRTYE